jgi:hypothetical protein
MNLMIMVKATPCAYIYTNPENLSIIGSFVSFPLIIIAYED